MECTAAPSSLSARLRAIESSKVFQGLAITVIIISALSVGARTYEVDLVLDTALNWLDTGITLFFLAEVLVRFFSSASKRDFFKQGWNWFDIIIVIGSLIPFDDASSILVARLFRIFRVLRLVSIIPELRHLVASLLLAIPRMGYIALMMFVIFYIYAVIGAIAFANINPDLWKDVSISMLTLFRIATFEDWTDIMYETMTVYPLSWVYYLSFIFLTAFIFLNMMIGAVLESMSQDTANQHQDSTEAKLDALQAQIAQLQATIEKQQK